MEYTLLDLWPDELATYTFVLSPSSFNMEIYFWIPMPDKL